MIMTRDVEPRIRTGRRDRNARGRGFTLVEVMAAFTILGIGLLSIAGSQVKSIHGTQRGRHLSTAALIAQSQLDQLARSRWTALAPTAGFTAPVTVSTTVVDGDAVATTEQSYQVSWRIQNVIPNETRSVDVRVTWAEENDGRARTAGASTIVFNRENL